MSVDNIADSATHLHGLLISKEKELKEREEEFARQVTLFNSENPLMGKDTDILELNVGGRINIAVSRRTLTQFESSVLAAQFSGRWDLEKDRNGNIFIDQKHDDFLILVDFLRLRMNSRSRQIPAKHLPKPTYSLCSMLECYDLMPGVYPQSWVGSDFNSEEKSYGNVVLSSKSKLGTVMACAVLNFGKFSDVGVSEFTCEFDRGTKGAVGFRYRALIKAKKV